MPTTFESIVDQLMGLIEDYRRSNDAYNKGIDEYCSRYGMERLGEGRQLCVVRISTTLKEFIKMTIKEGLED